MNYKIYFLAHPKVENHKQKIYKNCEIIYYKSQEYIKILILLFFYSSVIDYAIIYKKKFFEFF